MSVSAQKGKEENSRPLRSSDEASTARRLPIRGRKNNPPKLGVRMIELEGHGKKSGRSEELVEGQRVDLGGRRIIKKKRREGGRRTADATTTTGARNWKRRARVSPETRVQRA